jgi:hypothetical protein
MEKKENEEKKRKEEEDQAAYYGESGLSPLSIPHYENVFSIRPSSQTEITTPPEGYSPGWSTPVYSPSSPVSEEMIILIIMIIIIIYNYF